MVEAEHFSPDSDSVTKSAIKEKKNKKPVSYSSMVFNAFRSYIPTSNYSWLQT
jgi:hypothetical protein